MWYYGGMNTLNRPICAYPGCNKPGRNKGLYYGNRRWGRFCELHHKKKRTESEDSFIEFNIDRKEIDNSKCSACGWDKAYCDRHRIKKEVGYMKENVIVLCPNCHRLATLGLILAK